MTHGKNLSTARNEVSLRKSSRVLTVRVYVSRRNKDIPTFQPPIRICEHSALCTSIPIGQHNREIGMSSRAHYREFQQSGESPGLAFWQRPLLQVFGKHKSRGQQEGVSRMWKFKQPGFAAKMQLGAAKLLPELPDVQPFFAGDHDQEKVRLFLISQEQVLGAHSLRFWPELFRLLAGEHRRMGDALIRDAVRIEVSQELGFGGDHTVIVPDVSV